MHGHCGGAAGLLPRAGFATAAGRRPRKRGAELGAGSGRTGRRRQRWAGSSGRGPRNYGRRGLPKVEGRVRSP
eukprot:3714488-Alexandrium_andersonii.AAC.1